MNNEPNTTHAAAMQDVEWAIAGATKAIANSIRTASVEQGRLLTPDEAASAAHQVPADLVQPIREMLLGQLNEHRRVERINDRRDDIVGGIVRGSHGVERVEVAKVADRLDRLGRGHVENIVTTPAASEAYARAAGLVRGLLQ